MISTHRTDGKTLPNNTEPVSVSIQNNIEPASVPERQVCRIQEMSMDNSSASHSTGRIPVSRHQLRRNQKVTHYPQQHLRPSDKPISPLCTSFQNMPCPSSTTTFRRQSSTTQGSISSSILIVKTQNESLRSNYGSSEHLTSTKSAHSSSKGSLSNNNSFGDGVSLTSCGSMSNVSFNKVCVREYPRCIGDNVPSSGPPIGIDWDHQTQEEIPIDEYEKDRSIESKRTKSDLRIMPAARVTMLEEEWQTSMTEIMHASFESSFVREQRMKTILRSKSAERMQEIMESARHSLKKVSLKRVFSGSSGSIDGRKEEKMSRDLRLEENRIYRNYGNAKRRGNFHV